jgi:hypothetical protein
MPTHPHRLAELKPREGTTSDILRILKSILHIKLLIGLRRKKTNELIKY